jgi:hypothetical protein
MNRRMLTMEHDGRLELALAVGPVSACRRRLVNFLGNERSPMILRAENLLHLFKQFHLRLR